MNLFAPSAATPPQDRQDSSIGIPVKSVLSGMGITKRKIRKLDAIARANHPEGQKPKRAYSSRPFVLCGIPVRRPHRHSLEYSRQNGRFKLRVIGHPDYGLPFGQDRLLLIWIASMATWQKSRAIHFRSAATILETFSLPKDGRYYKRLIAGFERIFYSTFFFTSDEQNAETVVITQTSFRFVSTLKLWYTRVNPPDQKPDSIPGGNIIVLSEEFWNEIQRHPIPVDLNVVRALADSPGNLDLYIWLVWRSWTAKAPVNIPLFGPEGLVSQLGNSENLRERDFRRQIARWLKITHQLWPECAATLAESGDSLILRPARRAPYTSTSEEGA
jgi:replication initiator protein